MARTPHRTVAWLLVAAGLVMAAVAGCASGEPSAAGGPSSTRTITGTTGPDPTATGSGPPAAPPTVEPPASPTQPVPSPPPGGGTGINGITVIDGGCPVARADMPCQSRPVAATLRLLDAGTRIAVATITTGDDGQFAVAVAPGRYLLHPVTVVGGPPRRPVDLPVTVEPGHYTTITYLFDSGIR